MMTIPVQARPSKIHGTGVFATRAIPRGKVLWQYSPGLDRAVSNYSVKYGDPRTIAYIKERGFINPAQPEIWVLCIDEAQFLNFPKRGEAANIELGGLLDGEHLLLAARDIEEGEELLVPPESDADYERKMEGR